MLEQLEDSAERLVTVSTRGGKPVDLGIEDASFEMTYPVALPAGAPSYDE